jgi:hypothetical protein
MLYLEFVLPGPPVSYQTSDKTNLKNWQAAVKAEAQKTWTAAPLTGKLKFLLINFHEGDKPPLDDDNMVIRGTFFNPDQNCRMSPILFGTDVAMPRNWHADAAMGRLPGRIVGGR